ncbi:SH3 domain-containing protein [Leptospira meyeri]|uniref:SH3 domain-containing protein n=1 Tax=Leptospira meyeri TaxID=29508 RepID=UPI00108237AB|nr:SH3 domain-containing protein [Leptospira meyeri]MCW7488040.1 SH3 domain-containing protein [Leptospira meyeri]TGM63722.1 SH3 domain-containing protein [Leptospira meyeri]TGM67808.1 SH3 domain-containing protein [Leptospira meyeri]
MNIYSQPSPQSEIISTVPYFTKLGDLEYFDYKTIGINSGKWAKVSFQNKIGYLFDQFTIWDCSLYDPKIIEPDQINDRSILGYWGKENNSPYYIHFTKDHTFDAQNWNGCDKDGCIS